MLLAALTMVTVAHADTISVRDLLPRPVTVTSGKGYFMLPADKGALQHSVVTKLKKGQPTEGYVLRITPKRIEITASDSAGLFYGRQSLKQLAERKGATAIECATVTDYPRFAYRGLMVDVSRHFRSVEFLKKQIDAMAAMKLNRMHLHLTDGAGWRFPTEAYPRLTEYAAWRPQRSWQDWRNNGTSYCEQSAPRAYGGYYTKEQLRDLVSYAANRHITLIPEIEMPGHSEEVVAAYPELSCNGKGSDLCPGKEATFVFLEKVLDETMEIFPSHYIHVGGDEASKQGWKNCADCRERMKKEGLKNVDELQSYLIRRMENYLNSKGRSLVGWDEILEGGVAPNAVVMSWRGTDGGVKAMQEGHDVVMTPGEFCYIDYSQDAPFKEPVSIGGYTPLEKVYSYEPTEGIGSADARHLKGVQANLWAEYITEDSHAEYMYYPRACAIAEIGWSPAGKDYPDFRRRALIHNESLKATGYTTFDLATEYGQRHESLQPIEHLAKGAKVTYAIPYHEKYAAGGDTALTDGVMGGWSHGDHKWQGTLTDMDLTLDLGKVIPIHYISAGFMHSEGAWIQLPEWVKISVSQNGTDFTEVGKVDNDIDPTYAKIMIKNYGFPIDASARYIKLQAKKNPRDGAWLFLDEIVVK